MRYGVEMFTLGCGASSKYSKRKRAMRVHEYMCVRYMTRKCNQKLLFIHWFLSYFYFFVSTALCLYTVPSGLRLLFWVHSNPSVRIKQPCLFFSALAVFSFFPCMTVVMVSFSLGPTGRSPVLSWVATMNRRWPLLFSIPSHYYHFFSFLYGAPFNSFFFRGFILGDKW